MGSNLQRIYLLDGLDFLDEQEDTVAGPHLMGPVAGLAGTLFSAVPDATSSTCSNGMPDDGGGKQSGTQAPVLRGDVPTQLDRL